MAHYLLSVWHDEEYVVDFTTEEMQRIGPQVAAFNQELMDTGAWVYGAGLEPASTAIIFDKDGDDVATRDGSYANSAVQMGGFWIIDVADIDVARDWARRGALACEGPVELRAMQSE